MNYKIQHLPHGQHKPHPLQKQSVDIVYGNNRAIAQAVSLSAEMGYESQSVHVRFVMDKVAIGKDFL